MVALHTQYIGVPVTGGGMAAGINPTDWYAQ
jgi:hypothetical protein